MRALFDNVEELIESLRMEECLIIVEGRKDVEKLEEFGIHSVKLKGNLKSFCENVEARKVVLLMDTDREGKVLTHKLKTYFARLGVKTNLFYWNNLKKLRVTHVEGLKLKLPKHYAPYFSKSKSF